MLGGRYELPPGLSGAPEQQLRQLYAYLYRLVGALNVSGAGGGDSAELAALQAQIAAYERSAAASVAAAKKTADAGIAALRADMATQSAALSSLSARTDAVQTQLDAQGTDLTTLETGLTAQQAEIEELELDAQELSSALTTDGEDVIVAGSLTLGGTELTEASLRELLGLP